MESVKLYITKACAYCVALKIFLQEKNIEFEEIDVGENQAAQKEMIKKSGQMGVPVLEIGNEIVIGFDKEKICQLLNINE